MEEMVCVSLAHNAFIRHLQAQHSITVSALFAFDSRYLHEKMHGMMTDAFVMLLLIR